VVLAAPTASAQARSPSTGRRVDHVERAGMADHSKGAGVRRQALRARSAVKVSPSLPAAAQGPLAALHFDRAEFAFAQRAATREADIAPEAAIWRWRLRLTSRSRAMTSPFLLSLSLFLPP
jgi:hypothetical protein